MFTCDGTTALTVAGSGRYTFGSAWKPFHAGLPFTPQSDAYKPTWPRVTPFAFAWFEIQTKWTIFYNWAC